MHKAVYMGVNYWTEQMGLDAKTKAEEHREELLLQELLKFEDGVLGRSTSRVGGLMNW